MSCSIKEAILDAINIGSLATTFATLSDLIPHISALFSAIWMGFQVYEKLQRHGFVKRRKLKEEKNESTNDL